MSAQRKAIIVVSVAVALIFCISWFTPMHMKLIFIGDSLTQWYDWPRRFPEHSVMNLGIAGETLEGLLARRGAIRQQVKAPDLVFLMSGINDLLHGRTDISAPAGEMVRNLTTWYKGSTVVVQSLLPVDVPDVDNRTIEETNRRLRQIAQEHHAEYLDVYSAFTDGNGKVLKGLLDDDGVHLTSKGYDVWSKAVARFLQGRN